MDRAGLLSAVCMNVAKDVSVSLRRIADADDAAAGVGNSTLHK